MVIIDSSLKHMQVDNKVVFLPPRFTLYHLDSDHEEAVRAVREWAIGEHILDERAEIAYFE